MPQDEKIKVESIFQIGMVFENIDEKAKYFWEKLGIGPWYFMEFGPNAETTSCYGEPSSFLLNIALAQVGPVQLELIQPVSGKSPHMDFLKSGREGLHHLGILVDDMEQVESFKKLGYKVPADALGFGETKDGFGVYLDMQKESGILLELIHFPKADMSSSFYKVYPDPSEQK